MTGVSTLGQILNQIDGINRQTSLFQTLQTQLATGKITQEFSGLGNDVLTSQRARADFNSLDVFISNIQNGDRTLSLTLGAVEEFQAQATNLSGSLINFSQESAHQQGEEIFYDDPLTPTVENTRVGFTSAEPDTAFETLVDLSNSIFQVIEEVVNTRDGDRYLLAGAADSVKPFENTGTLDAALSNLIGQWKDGTISNEELIADLTSGATANNPDAISDTIVGFSAELSSGNSSDVYIRASESIEVEYTVRANEEPFRDILVGLAFIASQDLQPIADAYTPPNSFPGTPDAQGAPGTTVEEQQQNFFAVLNAVQTSVENALDGLDGVRFRVENARARIDNLQQSHVDTQNLLQNTIANVEDANLDEVAVQISSLATQLEASFAVTSRVQNLSLINFI